MFRFNASLLLILAAALPLSCSDTGYPFMVAEDTVEVPYTIGADGTVDVLVRNSFMATVRTLIQGELQEAGEYTVTWDLLNDLGIYPGDGLYTVEVYLDGERVSVSILEVNRQ
jgi:flagellar hook assembly protein FlgD